MRTELLLSVVAAVVAVACRPDPGNPDYPDISADSGAVDDGSLPGDTPFDPSVPRLAFSVFYEGQSTEEIVIDNAAVNYFIYDNTYVPIPDEDHVEGFTSDRLAVQAGAGYLGGGINFSGGPIDFTGWTTLHVALKSEDLNFEGLTLGVDGADQNGDIIPGRAVVSDFGFVADGEWHVLNIPISAMVPVPPLDQVTAGLQIIRPGPVEADTSFLIDDVYFTAEEVE
ncbi:MAG: hypothetical protein AAFV53_30925 [Myxococcota bacterium]